MIAIYSSDSDQDAKKNYVTDCHTKVTEIRLVIPPVMCGIKEGEMVEYKVIIGVFDEEAAIRIVYQNKFIEDTGANYQLFSLKPKSFEDHVRYKLEEQVLIEHSLVNFNRCTGYNIHPL